jgi:hypothetical protein
MIALICFVLTVLASPFKSKSRLEAENAVRRDDSIVIGGPPRAPPRQDFAAPAMPLHRKR